MIPATHGGLRYGSCPHCAQQPEHCLDPSSCALCRCDFCEGRRLLGGATGLAGSADFRLSDPKGCCQREDGGASGGCLSVDQPGNGVRAQAGGCAPCGQTALLDDAAEQLSEGLDRLSLCHGETLSGIEEEKLGTLLDILDESDESAQVKNAPDAASLGGSTAPGAEPRS